MAKSNKRPIRRRKITKGQLLTAGAVAIVLLAGVYLWARPSNNQPAAVTSGNNGSYVNLNPATEQERQQSQAAKDAVTSQQNQTQASSSGKKQVTPTITHADATSVSAYVSGVFEDGGTCTAIFTQGATTKTFTSTAFANVSYTSCAPIKVSGLASGTWTVVVSYNSSAATGQSQQQTVSA